MSDCQYCLRIGAIDPTYPQRPARYDVGSDCPRCARHWRYVCQRCGRASHFHGTFFCSEVGQILCFRCALDRDEAPVDFWTWTYYFSFRCPLCDNLHPALDRAEFLNQHPYQLYAEWEANRRSLCPDSTLPRQALFPPSIISPEALTDLDVGASWDAKAELWDGRYDEEGDSNRKYQSDEVLFGLLGEVDGQRVLDAGSGQGYLCRILARRGATVVGVEYSARFYELAQAYQAKEPLDIVYHRGSISDMPFLDEDSFDAIVSNYVLMDVRDYEAAIQEFARVLKPGHVAVIIITHPCFHTPGSDWLRVPPDSLRQEDRVRWMVDSYFHRGVWRKHWGPFDTAFIGFHRTLSDYYHTFQTAGLRVTDLEEPSVTARGEAELPSHRVCYLKRIPYSIAFRLERT